MKKESSCLGRHKPLWKKIVTSAACPHRTPKKPGDEWGAGGIRWKRCLDRIQLYHRQGVGYFPGLCKMEVKWEPLIPRGSISHPTPRFTGSLLPALGYLHALSLPPGPKERPSKTMCRRVQRFYSSLRERRTDRQCGLRCRPASLAPWTRHQTQPSPWYHPGKIPGWTEISTSDSSRPTPPSPSRWKQPNKLKVGEQTDKPRLKNNNNNNNNKHLRIRKRGAPPPE